MLLRTALQQARAAQPAPTPSPVPSTVYTLAQAFAIVDEEGPDRPSAEQRRWDREELAEARRERGY